MSYSATLPNAALGARSFGLLAQLYRGLAGLAPLADLAARLWVATAFFKSGLTKIQNFDSTILLFTYEYQVPLLSPELAAYLGTATELGFPILLALGLLGRSAAAVLFIFNLIAVFSYPAISLFTAIDHQAWGLLLFMIFAHGPGKLSLDHWLNRQYRHWPV